jgi:hypothetical protein
MGKDKHKGPDFLVPIPYVPEDEKEADPSDGRPPSVKLLLDSNGKKNDNPTVQVQPIFVNTSGKAGAQIPHLPLGDDSSPRGRQFSSRITLYGLHGCV